ncbi:MAG TPA: hypothetical protein VF644_05415 [Pyrinomonadaceae bacterium]|jgi:hypothetical protein
MSGNYTTNVKSANNANNANDEVIVENAIREYAKGLLEDDVIGEYECQIAEWEMFLNKVLDAERLALKNHEDTLKKVLNEQQEQDQLGAMFAMMALSLASGPALSWIVGAIETRVFPKYFSMRQNTSQKVLLEHKNNTTPTFFTRYRSENEYNQVAAKVFGEFTANVVQKGYIDPINYYISKLPERNAGNNNRSYQELTAIALIPDNDNSDNLYKSLKTGIENALKEEIMTTRSRIRELALNVRRDTQFGKTMLNILYKLNPQAEKWGLREKQKAAELFIENWIDGCRAEWAKKWLYFGNNPPTTSIYEMSRRLEREIWKMWILDQEFKFHKTEPTDNQDGATLIGFKWVEGRNKIKLHKLIVERLIDLGVVIPQTSKQFEALNERNFGKSNKEIPSVFVDDTVDSAEELAEIQSWAENHTTELLNGKFDNTPRGIGSIVNVHKACIGKRR